jgi:hypothetical protein
MKHSVLRWPVLGCARFLGAAANLCELGRGLAFVAHMRLICRAVRVMEVGTRRQVGNETVAIGRRWWITKDDFEEEKKRFLRIHKLSPELEQQQAAYEEKHRGWEELKKQAVQMQRQKGQP